MIAGIIVHARGYTVCERGPFLSLDGNRGVIIYVGNFIAAKLMGKGYARVR